MERKSHQAILWLGIFDHFRLAKFELFWAFFSVSNAFYLKAGPVWTISPLLFWKKWPFQQEMHHLPSIDSHIFFRSFSQEKIWLNFWPQFFPPIHCQLPLVDHFRWLMAEGRREEWPMSPGGRDMRIVSCRNPSQKSPEMWGDFFELAKKASNSRSSSYMFVTLLFSKGFMWKSCAYSYDHYQDHFCIFFVFFQSHVKAIATWSGKNRRFAKQSNAKLGRFIGCWTSSISTSASPTSTWMRDLTQDGDIEPNPGPSTFQIMAELLARSRWFEAQPSRVARPSWRTVNSMPMRWPLEGIKPCSWGVRCRRWGGFFLVGRQWEQDFPERMDPYFSKISWGCDPESVWLELLIGLIALVLWYSLRTRILEPLGDIPVFNRWIDMDIDQSCRGQYRSGCTIPANEGTSLAPAATTEWKESWWPRGKCLYWGSYPSYHLWWIRQTLWKTWKGQCDCY